MHLLRLSEGDPLYCEKVALLVRAGLRTELRLDAGGAAAAALHRAWLPCARVLCLNEAEAYFLEPDEPLTAQISPRNEAAALSLLLDELRSADGEGVQDALRAVKAHCDALPCAADAGEPCAAAAAAADAAAAAAAWAHARGVRTRFHAATFGGLRGAAADGDVGAGDAVAELPAAALVTAAAAWDAPALGDALRAVEGMDDDTAALVWTMCERLDAASPLAPLWASLPQAPLHTGLTLPRRALAALEGTLLHEEVRRLQAAARQQYDALFPALPAAFPAAFAGAAPTAYTFDAYCLAAELWQAYAVRLARPGGGEPVSALLPQALLLNHSCAAAHVVRFSVPDADGVLRLRALRGCPRGAQLYLSYGALPNAQLLQYYGFALAGNPCDTFPLAFELPEAEEDDAAPLRAALLARWQLGLEHSLRRGRRLPSRLLGALRVLTAPADELSACAHDPRHAPLSADNEATVVATLVDTLEALLEAQPAAPAVEEGDDDAAALAHCATYLREQRAILEDAQRQCADLMAALAGGAEGRKE